MCGISLIEFLIHYHFMCHCLLHTRPEQYATCIVLESFLMMFNVIRQG